MPTPAENAREILRLRDRLHVIGNAITVLQAQVGSLEEWTDKYEPIIEDLREADRIAEAVAERIREDSGELLTQTGQKWTKWQVRAAWSAVAVALLIGATDIGLRLAG